MARSEVNAGAKTSVEKTAWGKLPDRTAVDLYTLTNKKGAVCKITTYGATVTEIIVPDKNGKPGNIVLGYDSLDKYLASTSYFGAIVGRVANRIAGGKFNLNGADYTLAKNNGPNMLHGGLAGFDKKVWQAKVNESSEGPSVKFSLTSKDMEEGFPGTVKVVVVYMLTQNNQLKIDYQATADKDTPINLSNHSYFNLAGAGNGDVLNHELMLAADHYTPVDDTMIPTGEIKSVKGTPMDFTSPHTIGSRIADVKGGYDHNYVFIENGIQALAARVKEPTSGRVMEMYTSEPGVQFYTGNFLDGKSVGLGGAYKKHYGFCLEAQHFPDSVNHANFPSTILGPGQLYEQLTVYKFLTE